MTTEPPADAPGPAPKNRINHYLALVVVVVVLVIIFAAVL